MSGSEKELEAVHDHDSTPLYTKQVGDVPPPYAQQPAAAVVYAPQAAPAVVTGPPPEDYMVMSILTTFCCFWPLGIIALIKSMEVRSAVARGDYAGAQAASKTALTLNKVAIIVGIISVVITILIVFLCQLTWIIPLANRRYYNY